MFDLGAQTEGAAGPLPLPPGATLAWLGFSDDGGLAKLDSGGALAVLSLRLGGRWVTALDTSQHRKSRDESF